jgi:hypothetical protein
VTREREVTVHSRRYIVDSATRPRIAPDDAPSGHDTATQHSELLHRSEPVGGAARVIPTHVSVERRDGPAPPQYEADEGALTQTQLNQIKMLAPKTKLTKSRSSLFYMENA